MEFKDKTSNSQSIHQADVSSRLPNFFGRALLRPPLPVQVLWWSDWHFFVKVKIIGHYIAHCAQRYDSDKSHLMRSCYFSFFSAEPLNGSISRASGIFHDDRGLWSKWSKSLKITIGPSSHAINHHLLGLVHILNPYAFQSQFRTVVHCPVFMIYL